MTFEDKTVLVAGMALSGTSSAALLRSLDARLILYDAKPREQLSEETRAVLDTLQFKDFLGVDPLPALDAADLVVVSPGLPPALPLLAEAKRRRLPVISEIELGYCAGKGDLIAVTGTNGKTTTTALTGALFTNDGRPTHVLGNIGTPLTSHALVSSDEDTLVVETAALQLDDIDTYHPAVCAVLNVTPDHLDRYGTMERYAAAKARVFENQTPEDWCVLNFDDPIVRAFAQTVPSRVLWFSLSPIDADGVFVEDGTIRCRIDREVVDIMPASEVRIPGRHNLHNAMAAAAMAAAKGVQPDVIAYTLRTFPGVEHRIETVDERNGVVYINDSKGTNPDATQKAIEAMVRPTVLILGGFDKHADFAELFDAMRDPVRHIVVLGATADKILQCAAEAGWKNIERADSFEEAVCAASTQARPGEAVLLSPACASWDMFESFEERGNRFKEIVRSLL